MAGLERSGKRRKHFRFFVGLLAGTMTFSLGSAAASPIIIVDPAPAIEVCAAGDDVPEGAVFHFTVSYSASSSPSTTLSVTSGTCERLNVAAMSDVTVTETVPTGMHVTAITVEPEHRVVEGPDLDDATVVVRSGGFADLVRVSFANAWCKPGIGRGDKNHCHRGVTAPRR